MTVWLTIPCHRPRLEWLKECIHSTGIPRDRVVVVTNGPDPIRYDEIPDLCSAVITDDDPELNISRWWNLGMDYIHRNAEGEYEILVANADTLSDGDTIEALRVRLRQLGVAAVAPDQGRKLLPWEVRVSHDPRDYAFTKHMWGYFFMLAGEKKLQADEDIRWWLSDNILEVYAKQNGGFALIGGTHVEHRSQTPYEEPWITWGAEDREKMDAKLFHLDYFHQRS